jgi:Rieske Fe-S protein
VADTPESAPPRAGDTSRRGFLKVVSGLVTAGLTAALGMPALAYVLGPLLGRKEAPGTPGASSAGGAPAVPAVKVASAGALAVGMPVRLDVVTERRDAWTVEDNVRLGSVWLVKRDSGKVDCYSTVCPHLGCAVDYDEKQKRFACPCHDSVFALDSGKVVSGPSPRPMDALDVERKGEELWVRFQRFRQGTPRREPA